MSVDDKRKTNTIEKEMRFVICTAVLRSMWRRREINNSCCFLGDDIRLIIMRIRFRAWDIGSGRKNKHHSCKIERSFSCWDGARAIRFLARVIPQLGFWTKINEANVDYTAVSGAAPRALRSALWAQVSKLTLTDSSLAAKRRAEALHVVFFFNKAPGPRTMSC